MEEVQGYRGSRRSYRRFAFRRPVYNYYPSVFHRRYVSHRPWYEDYPESYADRVRCINGW